MSEGRKRASTVGLEREMSVQPELVPQNDAERQALLDACELDAHGMTLPAVARRRVLSRGRAAAEVIQAAAEALERISRGQPLNPMSA